MHTPEPPLAISAGYSSSLWLVQMDQARVGDLVILEAAVPEVCMVKLQASIEAFESKS